MSVILYHNPACGTSRNALALLHEAGIEPTIVEYLKTPLDRNQLAALLKRMNIGVRELLRAKGDLYNELKLDDPIWSEDELIDMIARHPVLMNRPVVVTEKGACLARPAEKLLAIL